MYRVRRLSMRSCEGIVKKGLFRYDLPEILTFHLIAEGIEVPFKSVMLADDAEDLKECVADKPRKRWRLRLPLTLAPSMTYFAVAE
jgi:hypothetical protein